MNFTRIKELVSKLDKRLLWYVLMRTGRWVITRKVLMIGSHRSAYLVEPFDSSKMNFRKLRHFLICAGFQENYVAMCEPGEIYNMRAVYEDENGEERQVHVRVFDDELRAHDEYSYEYDFYKHYHSIGKREVSDTIRRTLLEYVDITLR